tara:strand:+ start:301 stop:543 length:243 start_codon:yes stop_codon:yes gene_type:complete
MPTKIQSVILSKKKFTLKQANNWIKKNNFKLSFYRKPVEKTKNFYRYRQIAPHHFKKYRMKKVSDGVEFVLGLIPYKNKK